MKKITASLFGIIASLSLFAQTPSVTTNILNTTSTTIEAEFQMGENCTKYAILADALGSMTVWTQMMGVSLEELVIQWGIMYEQNATYTWDELNPNTPYEVFVVAMNETDTADVVITNCSTASQGGEGESLISIELSELTKTSVRMITVPNDQTAYYYNGLVTKELYDEVGEDSVMSILKSTPYQLCETDDWVWQDLMPYTEYYALAQGANVNDEWGVVSKVAFRTLGDVSITQLEKEQTLLLYPNPAKDFVVLQNSVAGDEVELSDIQGRVLQKFVTNTSKTRLNVSDCKPGFYFVRIKNAESAEETIGKLIIND